MIHLRNTLAIVVTALVIGVLYNTFSGRGIPWVPKVDAQGPQPRLILSDALISINYMELEEARIRYDRGVTFVDAREADQYVAGHIAGALHISAGEEAEAILHALRGKPKEADIVVYCDGEECGSSTTLAGKLQRLGFTSVHVFFGGWTEWLSASLPVEKGR